MDGAAYEVHDVGSNQKPHHFWLGLFLPGFG
jgi:hypothetical protein